MRNGQAGFVNLAHRKPNREVGSLQGASWRQWSLRLTGTPTAAGHLLLGAVGWRGTGHRHACWRQTVHGNGPPA